MSFTKNLSVLCASLLFSALAGAACQKEEASCDDNETQECACGGGVQGVQTCNDGEWGQCDCGGGGSASDGSSASASGSASDGSSASASASDGSSASASASASDGSSASDSATTGPTSDSASDSATTGMSGPAVGSPCTGPADCGAGQICVVQNGDDVQGICTIVCSDWTDCGSDKIGQSFWDCCDLSNGSFACAPDTWECEN